MDTGTEAAYTILQTTGLTPADAGQNDWISICEMIIYYALPVIIGLGLVLGVLNIIVLANQVTVSIDSYLIGLSLASTLLLVCAVIIEIPEYVRSEQSDEIFARMTPIVKGLYDWFKYTVVWTIIVMSLERCMNVTQHRIKSLCSKLQAGIAIAMVYLICLVSALPEFWAHEIQVTAGVVDGRNVTKVTAIRAPSASSPEYNIYYWYTHVFYVFLAYLMLIILFFVLAIHTSRSTSRKYSLKHGTGVVLARKVSQEMSLTRLHVTLIFFYLLFTGPLTVYKLLPVIPVKMNLPDPEKTLHGALISIFECSFYFFFIMKFFLLLLFNGKYRFTLRNLCCCCCPKKE